MSDSPPPARPEGRPEGRRDRRAEGGGPTARPDRRSARERAGDHAAIDRLADELVPALIAKLGSTNLGEIEVREGDWRLRLRRPTIGSVNYGRRATDGASRAQPGHAGHAHAPGVLEGHRPARGGTIGAGGTAGVGGNGTDAPGLAAVGPGRTAEGGPEPGDADRSFATSPAVGVFQPATAVSAGTRVRAGDRLGVVDMLGVPHEVVAPMDGVIGASLVEAGHAVEYGQELIRIELAGGRESGGEGSRQAGREDGA